MNKIAKRVLFIYPAIENESMAIEYLSSALKKNGHKTDLLLYYPKEKNFKKRLLSRIRRFNPDFIGFSVMTDDYAIACKIAAFIKKHVNIPTIFGGMQVTSCPEEVISRDFVDYIVLGEGEEAIVELVENSSDTTIKNVWFKKNNKIIKNDLRPLISNLDSIPFPDKGLFAKEAPYLKDIYHCITSRGCPFNCTYCFNNYMRRLYKGCQWLRRRSAENVIEELKIMKRKLNYSQILFIDDCFTYDKEWLEKFINLYKREINLPFKIIAHPVFMTPEVVSLLKKGGCLRVQLGVQTPVERIRKDICKRIESNEIVKKAVTEIKKKGIIVQIDHIFGLPSENLEEYEKGLEFYIDVKPTMIYSFWLQYYPNTEIVEIGKKYGKIDEKTMQDTIRGEINYTKNVLNMQSNPDLLAISKFFYWIPILPKSLSKYILRKKLYYKLFKINLLNKIPYFLNHLKSYELLHTVYLATKRKIKMKLYYLGKKD